MRTTYNVSVPGFVADDNSVAMLPGGQIDWLRTSTLWLSPVSATNVITLNDAAAAQLDVAITVLAIPVDLPSGTVLDFGVHSVTGYQMLAKLSASATAGATTLAVEPLSDAIENATTANYVVSTFAETSKVIPAGTLMAKLASGLWIPRVDVVGAQTASAVLYATVNEESEVVSSSGVGLLVGGVLYETLMPDFVNANWATWKAEIQTAGVSTILFTSYSDSRAV